MAVGADGIGAELQPLSVLGQTPSRQSPGGGMPRAPFCPAMQARTYSLMVWSACAARVWRSRACAWVRRTHKITDFKPARYAGALVRLWPLPAPARNPAILVHFAQRRDKRWHPTLSIGDNGIPASKQFDHGQIVGADGNVEGVHACYRFYSGKNEVWIIDKKTFDKQIIILLNNSVYRPLVFTDLTDFKAHGDGLSYLHWESIDGMQDKVPVIQGISIVNQKSKELLRRVIM